MLSSGVVVGCTCGSCSRTHNSSSNTHQAHIRHTSGAHTATSATVDSCDTSLLSILVAVTTAVLLLLCCIDTLVSPSLRRWLALASTPAHAHTHTHSSTATHMRPACDHVLAACCCGAAQPLTEHHLRLKQVPHRGVGHPHARNTRRARPIACLIRQQHSLRGLLKQHGCSTGSSKGGGAEEQGREVGRKAEGCWRAAAWTCKPWMDWQAASHPCHCCCCCR